MIEHKVYVFTFQVRPNKVLENLSHVFRTYFFAYDITLTVEFDLTVESIRCSLVANAAYLIWEVSCKLSN